MNGDQITPTHDEALSEIFKDKRFSWTSGFYDNKSKRVTASQMLLWEQNGAKIEAVTLVPKVKRGLGATAEHWLCKVSNDFDNELFRCTDYQWRAYLAKKNNEPAPLSPGEVRSLEKIRYLSRWAELFGEKGNMKRPEYRKAAWEAWKKTAHARKPDEQLKRFLQTLSGEDCDGCTYKQGDWCGLMELPCIYNPVIPDRIGMACMGAHRKEVFNEC